MRKCGHVVKNLSKMKVVVGDTLVVRWIWVSFFFKEQMAAKVWKNSKAIWFLQSEFLEQNVFAKISGIVRWIWVSREILANALFSKNSDWRNQIVLEFFLNFAVVCSSKKIPTGDVYTFGPSNWFCCIIFVFSLFDFYGRNFVSGSDGSRILQQFQSKFWSQK